MKRWRGEPDNFKFIYKPTPREKGHMWLGMACADFFLAAYAYFYPPTKPATGLFRAIHNIFLNYYGMLGDVVLYLLLGTAFSLFAFYGYLQPATPEGRAMLKQQDKMYLSLGRHPAVR